MNTIAEYAPTQTLGRLEFTLMYAALRRPVVIRGGAASWSACKTWSPSHLAARLPEKVVNVCVCQNDYNVFDYQTRAITRATMRFSDAIALISSDDGHRYAIQQQSITKHFRELTADIEPPRLLDANRISSMNLWISGKSCKTPLHIDDTPNFLAQIFGRKRVILFSPDESKNLYPGVDLPMPHCSRVDVFAPDFGAFPRYSEAIQRKLVLDLNPGDILYLPKGWWHAVESVNVSISVNFWHAHRTPLGYWMARVLHRPNARPT
jgi:hypothetical protein